MGHGTSSTIAAFSNNNFRRFLLALNFYKNVSSLLYLTCSGAGKHLIEPYTEENGQSPIRLNYAIACQSLCSSGSVVAIMNFAQLFRELANKRENQTWDNVFRQLCGKAIVICLIFPFIGQNCQIIVQNS